MMFKAHILSYIEYRTPGIAHASTTTLRPIDRILARFLREIGMSENAALLYFGLAPLATRRGIAMLGVVHRAVLRQGPEHLHGFFTASGPRSRLGGRSWHHRHVSDIATGLRKDYLSRSLLGYAWVYNLLPDHVVAAGSVNLLQRECQLLLKSRVMESDWRETFSCRIAPRRHALW